MNDWDVAYARTEEREVINPRPLDEAQIFRTLQPFAGQGFLTYSEGCNDDVNKAVWSALGWNPDVDELSVLREYGRYFIGPDMAESFAEGLLSLERNWRGPLLTNARVDETLAGFQEMKTAGGHVERTGSGRRYPSHGAVGCVTDESVGRPRRPVVDPLRLAGAIVDRTPRKVRAPQGRVVVNGNPA